MTHPVTVPPDHDSRMLTALVQLHDALKAAPLALDVPGAVTRRPTSELTSVDLPAPVEPPTTASSGASTVICRGRT